jgi:hypothetical protein
MFLEDAALKPIRGSLKGTDCRLLKKISEARHAKFEELKRTFQYVEASRAKRNEAYESFSATC